MMHPSQLQRDQKIFISGNTPLFFFLLLFILENPFTFFNKQLDVFVYHIRMCDCQCDSVVVTVIGSCCHISGYIGV